MRVAILGACNRKGALEDAGLPATRQFRRAPSRGMRGGERPVVKSCFRLVCVRLELGGVNGWSLPFLARIIFQIFTPWRHNRLTLAC